MLNGVNTWALDNKELFGKSEHPGIDATIMAVEGITGLKINYWAMVNLKGFRDLVDAVGGVTLNVRSRIPIGGLGSDVYDYIEPGKQKLTGFQTQWYARAREGSDDYSRMARQKCVMAAMLDQLDPTVGAPELPEDRQGLLGDGARPASRPARSTASSAWRSRPRARRSRRSRSCRRSSTPTSRTPG